MSLSDYVNFTGKPTQAGANLAARRGAAVHALKAGHQKNLQETNVRETFEQKLAIQQLAEQLSR